MPWTRRRCRAQRHSTQQTADTVGGAAAQHSCRKGPPRHSKGLEVQWRRQEPVVAKRRREVRRSRETLCVGWLPLLSKAVKEETHTSGHTEGCSKATGALRTAGRSSGQQKRAPRSGVGAGKAGRPAASVQPAFVNTRYFTRRHGKNTHLVRHTAATILCGGLRKEWFIKIKSLMRNKHKVASGERSV